MWFYKQTEPCLWTVMIQDGQGGISTDSDHGVRDDARARVHYLNGGCALLGILPSKVQKQIINFLEAWASREKKCIRCKRSFSALRSDRKYCSVKCQTNAATKKFREKGKDHASTQDPQGNSNQVRR